MYDEEKILEELGATHASEEAKQQLLDHVGLYIGREIEAQLSEQKRNEYKAILDADQEVIYAWLEQNMPEYKNSELYKEVMDAYETDPEKVQPEKVIATIGWVTAEVPNLEAIVTKVVEAFKRVKAGAPAPSANLVQ